MKLTLEMIITNIYKAKDFTDKKTGEVTKGKWKIQTMDKIDTEDGQQMKIYDISFPIEKLQQYKNMIGKSINLPVSTYVANGRVGYYGI